MRRAHRRTTHRAGNEIGLFAQVEDLTVETGRKRDLEATIVAFRSMLRRARGGDDREAEGLCLMQLAWRLWEAGRLEAALRHFEQYARLGDGEIGRWTKAVALHRALGRPQRALRLATTVLEAAPARLAPTEACYRAEMYHEAALSAHLLGRREDAIVWLERATVKLPRSLKPAHEVEARQLLHALRLLTGAASPTAARRLAESASADKGRPLAAAAAAVAAWALGDQEGLARWREEARLRARGSVGQPFCHDDWQQPYALLRAIPQ